MSISRPAIKLFVLLLSFLSWHAAGGNKKALAGKYTQTYSNGHKDSTTVACDGAMTWRANKLKGTFYPAGSKLPASRAAQNNDPNYQAKDGWYFRAWDRPKAWEFVKFEHGNMIVHHFCTDSAVCNKKSPAGSAKYCCGSTSKRVPSYCGGAFKCCRNACLLPFAFLAWRY